METTLEVRTMSPANKTRVTAFSASIVMLIFFSLADIFHYKLIFWSLALLSFIFSGACHMLANYLSRKSGNTATVDKTIHHMNNKMIMFIIYSLFVPLKLVHWTFVLVITFAEFTMIMIMLLGLLDGQPFHKKGNHKLWRRIKRASQIFAATVFFVALFNYSETIHLNVLQQYITPFRENLIWQRLHIGLEIIIAGVSLTAMFISVFPYRKTLLNTLQNMYYDKSGKRIFNKDSSEIAYRRVSPANKATLLGLLLSFVMVVFFLLAEFSNSNRHIYILFAFAFFAISMAMDYIDGKLAVKYKTTGEASGALDQIRDKMSILMIFLPMMAFKSISANFFIVIILRELMVSMFRIIYLHQLRKGKTVKIGISAKIWGKMKTVAQSIAAIILGFNLLCYNQEMYWPWLKNHFNLNYYVESYSWSVSWITLQILIAVFSSITGLLYAIKYKSSLYIAFMDVKTQEKAAQQSAE